MTITHRMTGTPTYTSWRKMRERCLNPNAAQWRWYGKRGVLVCDRWSRFETFLADMGERPAGTTLDRIDPNKGYSPDNCRWATQAQQVHGQQKTRRVGGVVVAEVARQVGVRADALTARLRRGVPQSEVFSPMDRRRPVTTAEIEAYSRLAESGLKQKEIAAAMGVVVRRVERMARMKRRGLAGWKSGRMRGSA